jgi:hypothetical protein
LKTHQRLTVGGIYTDRYVPGYDQASYHLVYEWEDQISATAGLPVLDSREPRRLYESPVARTLLKVPGVFEAFHAVDTLVQHPTKSLYFVMSPQQKTSFSTRANVIPMIVDFWKTVDLPWFYRTYGNAERILISSREAFNFLKERRCPLNLHHFPLSLPDKYAATPETRFEKRYDIVLAGRPNATLLEFMRRYAKDHPDIEFLSQTSHEGKLCYTSNKRGIVGAFEDRSSYMNLLRASRVGFYATPGIDGGEARTGGFNPVTPRFFELLAAQCQVVARYPDNDDTRFYELNALSPSVDTYEAFEATLTAALRTDPPMDKYSAYLKKHYTSGRVQILDQIFRHQD